MRKLIFSINVSIDGFADHTVAVAADDELHDFFTNQLDNIDTVIFGRKTYQLFESYCRQHNWIQRALKASLINDYWLMVHPVIWGNGTRLFDGLNERKNLMLADTGTFKSGVVVLHYLTERK